jgi:hypothetical protein
VPEAIGIERIGKNDLPSRDHGQECQQQPKAKAGRGVGGIGHACLMSAIGGIVIGHLLFVIGHL